MEYIRTFTVEFDVGREAELSIENRSGAVSLRGDDTEQVRVEVVARLWGEGDVEADEQAGLIRRGIRQDGKRVTVRAATLLRPRPLFFFGRGPRVDYQLTVPRATRAKILSRSGRVEVENVAGPLDIEPRSGRVSLREIGGDATVSSTSGAVHAESLAGSLSVVSRSGGVKAQGIRGNVTVQIRSGSLQLEDVRGNVKIEARSGSATISNVGGALTIKTGSGSIRYSGPVRGPFDITLISGSVRLAPDPDSSFVLDAQTASGSARSDLPVRERPPPSDAASAPTVRIRTISGSIHIGDR